MTMPVLVLYDKEHCDAVVLVQRLRVLNAVRDNFKGQPTPMIDAAIETLEDLLAEHLPTLPPERML
jgi:hypothetical protein